MPSATLSAPARPRRAGPHRRATSAPSAACCRFLRPYRLRIAAAGVFLVLAAATTLVFPVALKSLIDTGFVVADPGARVMALREHFFALFGGRRRARPVLGSALLHGELARRARDGRPARRRLRARGPAEPRVLRDHADRRGPVAPDHRHDAGADRRRLQPVDGPAQRGDGHRRDGDAGRHQPRGHDAGARHPGPGRAALDLLRSPRPAPVARQPGPHRRLERDRGRGAERDPGGAELPAGGARGGALHRIDRARLRHRRAAHADALAARRLRHQRDLRRPALGPLPGHAGRAARRHHGRATSARRWST